MLPSFSQFLVESAAEPELVDLQEALTEEEFAQLEESLGNLASLGAGNLLNVFKQSASRSRHGSGVSQDGSRFNQNAGWRPGQGSEIRDIGTIKSWKDIRKAFKKDPAIGAVVYFNSKPYISMNFGYTEKFGVNDIFVVAADPSVLTPDAAQRIEVYMSSIKKYQNMFNAKKTGIALTARELEVLIDKVIEEVGNDGRMTAKTISFDEKGFQKTLERQQNNRRNDPLKDRQELAGSFFDPLKKKLSDFKAAKAKDSFRGDEKDKILDFVLKNPGKKFAIDGKLVEATFSRTVEGWEKFVTGQKTVNLLLEGDGYHPIKVKLKDGKLVVA